jgi:hypothetical protein
MRRKQSWDERYAAHIRSPYWAELKRKVIARRGHKCEPCGKEDVPLDLHHLHYKTFGRERQKDVRLCCRECHQTEDAERKIRGDARRIWARLRIDEAWEDGDFTDAEVSALIRGGVIDPEDSHGLAALGHVIDCWDEDENPEPGTTTRGFRDKGQNDSFRAAVRAMYERKCGPRCVVRERIRAERQARKAEFLAGFYQQHPARVPIS